MIGLGLFVIVSVGYVTMALKGIVKAKQPFAKNLIVVTTVCFYAIAVVAVAFSA